MSLNYGNAYSNPRYPYIFFAPKFYQQYYSDLSSFSNPKDLRRHYARHGKSEGRSCNAADLISKLEKRYGQLPTDFNPEELSTGANSDLLKAGIDNEWKAVEHYLRYGRQEGRHTFPFHPAIYKELYFINCTISDRDLWIDYDTKGRSEDRIGSGADVMRLKGIVGGGRWIEELKPDEFALLNYSWAGPIATRMEAVDVMLSKGISLTAPISFALEFDAAFYRETNPGLTFDSDEACYRHWLFIGFEQGQPGSPQQFFAELGISLQNFPSAFQWKTYLNQASDGTRWDALRHFILEGFGKGIRPVHGSDAGTLFVALGTLLSNKNDTLAIEAFELAKVFGALKEHAVQELADCYFRLEQWAPALDCYVDRMRYPGPDVWTYCYGARAALKLNKTELAFEILKEGKDKVVGSPEWRKVLDEAIRAEFEAEGKKAREFLRRGAVFREAADRTVRESPAVQVAKRYADFDPSRIPLPVAPNGKVVVLANVDLRQCTHYRVEQKEQLFEKLGYQIFAASEAEESHLAFPERRQQSSTDFPLFP